MVSRCNAEALQRGSFVFVTLTYDEEHLPYAQSLWRISKDTGEYELVEKGEIVLSARYKRCSDIYKERREEITDVFKSLVLSDKPRYYETTIDGFEDDEYIYKARLTPSVCRKDVRLWLKRARVKYEREHGFKLSPFSYVAISEYGPNTCRPHYHLAFFGLNRLEAQWIAEQWDYGFTNVKYVNRVNEDGSDGFTIAARYIGKYMTKGKFDCESVCDKSAEKPRVCQSKGIGASLIDSVRSSMCCFDMYGEYNLDTLFCPTLGRCFNESEIKQLCNEIPKRLSYVVSAKFRLPIPRLFRNKVFCHEVTESVYRRVFRIKNGQVVPEEVHRYQTAFVPTTIWSLVADSIRTNLSEDNQRKFEQFISAYDEREISKASDDFAYYEKACNSLSDKASEARYIDFLHSSIF